MNITPGTDTVRPIRLVPGDGGNSHRAGGGAPAGVEPICKTAKYLLTVGLDESRFLSVFQTFEGNYDIEHAVELQGPGDGIEVLFHQTAPRRNDNRYAAEFSPVGLELDAPRKDEFFDGQTLRTPDSGDKLGGKPFEFQGGSRTLNTQLHAAGFEQFLQLDFAMLARRELNVTGTVPFMHGIFHLFLKPNTQSGDYEWRCYWEIL